MDIIQCLLHIKQLSANNIKVIFLDSIDGINKATMAKIAINDTKHTYGLLCFDECSESGWDCFIIFCKILEEIKYKSKPKDLEEAQKILKECFTKNKIILVFDDIKNLNQIKDVVPMDALFISNSSKLIVTTED